MDRIGLHQNFSIGSDKYPVLVDGPIVNSSKYLGFSQRLGAKGLVARLDK